MRAVESIRPSQASAPRPRVHRPVRKVTASALAGLVVSLVAALVLFSPSRSDAAVTTYARLNAGGPALSGWGEDSATNPSALLANAVAGEVASTTASIDLSHPSVPAGTPAALFETARYASDGQLAYRVPVPAG